MRSFSTFLLAAMLFFVASGWETDFSTAQQKAKSEHKLILLNFSGSDWCGPCIRMHKEIFENDQFKQYADTSLVLINADFPRLRKNQLPKDQQGKNDKLADKYNPNGIFPLTVLLDSDGKMIFSWEGYPNLSAEQFVNKLKGLANAHN